MDTNLAAMYEHFTNGFASEAATIIGAPVEIRYQGNVYTTEPDRSKYWVRLSTVTLRSEQATLSTSASELGKKRYKVRGMIFVQVFGPRQTIGANEKCGELAYLARKILRKNPPQHDANVWFTNATAENLEPIDNWLRWDTSASFTFDEFQ